MMKSLPNLTGPMPMWPRCVSLKISRIPIASAAQNRRIPNNRFLKSIFLIFFPFLWRAEAKSPLMQSSESSKSKRSKKSPIWSIHQPNRCFLAQSPSTSNQAPCRLRQNSGRNDRTQQFCGLSNQSSFLKVWSLFLAAAYMKIPTTAVKKSATGCAQMIPS